MNISNPETKLGSALLLTAAGSLLAQSSAQAQVYDENTTAPGGDFGNAFAGRTTLTLGTMQVNGDTEFAGTDPDFYTYTGLLSGQPFTLGITAGADSDFYQATFMTLDDNQTQVGSTASYAGDPAGTMRTISGTVPASGNLTVAIQQSAEEGSVAYSTSLSVVPEPATTTLALLGAVVAGLVARRRS